MPAARGRPFTRKEVCGGRQGQEGQGQVSEAAEEEEGGQGAEEEGQAAEGAVLIEGHRVAPGVVPAPWRCGEGGAPGAI